MFHDVPIDWEDRTQLDYYTFTLKTGVSLEHQVLLCNTLGTNPWFNLPHRATDLYVGLYKNIYIYTKFFILII